MHPVLRRIAVRGALAALILAVLGVVFAEVASIWLSGSGGARATAEPAAVPSESNDAFASSLRSRVPLFMAVWGFAFAAAGEFAMHLWRSRKPALPPQPHEGEKVWEELLTQAESRQGTGGGGQESANGEKRR